MTLTSEDDPEVFVANVCLRPDLKNLEITSKSVERMLEPLVVQVTTLVKGEGPSNRRKGKSKKAKVIVAALESSTANFITRGDQIAHETPEITNEMLKAVGEVKDAGEIMSKAAREFANDPCTSDTRLWMVESARQLLFAVCRLLILADMVDVIALIKSLQSVESSIDRLKNVSSMAELQDNFQNFQKTTAELLDQATKRQNELKDPQLRDDLAAARATLKRSTDMLLTASKLYLRHPEIAEAKANRDFLLKEVCEAVNIISDIAQGKPGPTAIYYDQTGDLSKALQNFESKVVMEPLEYNEVVTRPDLELLLEAIIGDAALIAEAPNTRNNNKLKIVQECDNVRLALQDLLSEYMDNMGKETASPGLVQAMDDMHANTKKLRRHLRRAAMDNVSDRFITTTEPIKYLVESAYAGNQEDTKYYGNMLNEHTGGLAEVSEMISSMSDNEEGVRMVRATIDHLLLITPQVVYAAAVLASRNTSKVAQENMESFKNAWEEQVQLLTEAVDDITTIEDFLAVSESHIIEDVSRCLEAIKHNDPQTLSDTAENIKGRTLRVCHVVEGEMDDYEACPYSDNVLEAVKILRDQALLNFGKNTTTTIDELNDPSIEDLDDNEFISASHLMCDSLREVRMAVLMTNEKEEVYLEEQKEEGGEEDAEGENIFAEIVDIQEDEKDIADLNATDASEVMKNLSEEERGKIVEQVENFQLQKMQFDKEVAKWDDTENDIVMMAKHMCIIMMQMTEFTRGQGPLKSSMDVINAAKKISEAGIKLDRIAREVSDQCPPSRSKNDVLAVLDKIALYCHQLSITAKVKTDVENISSSNLIVSGLDSATSLIQASKNLMSAVVETVKSCYVASTKYKSEGVKLIEWKMKPPEKKPLVKVDKQHVAKSKPRKYSTKKPESAIKTLSEFQL